MTFRDFCEEIGDGVLSVVPAAKYQEPKQLKGPAVVNYGGMKATITRADNQWLVTFSRTDGGPANSSMTGEKMTAATASNVAQQIAGFLT